MIEKRIHQNYCGTEYWDRSNDILRNFVYSLRRMKLFFQYWVLFRFADAPF